MSRQWDFTGKADQRPAEMSGAKFKHAWDKNAHHSTNIYMYIKIFIKNPQRAGLMDHWVFGSTPLDSRQGAGALHGVPPLPKGGSPNGWWWWKRCQPGESLSCSLHCVCVWAVPQTDPVHNPEVSLDSTPAQRADGHHSQEGLHTTWCHAPVVLVLRKGPLFIVSHTLVTPTVLPFPAPPEQLSCEASWATGRGGKGGTLLSRNRLPSPIQGTAFGAASPQLYLLAPSDPAEKPSGGSRLCREGPPSGMPGDRPPPLWCWPYGLFTAQTPARPIP